MRRFPGNTVVADIVPGCSAYDVMLRLRKAIEDAGFGEYFTLLPTDSYHMTVIRGLNDQVRTDTNWPAKLPKDTPMAEVDDYVSAAIARAGLPGPFKMKFDALSSSDSVIIVHLVPADEQQRQRIWEFRDRAAEEIGLRLPGHERYRFHISLGYTRVVPEGEAAERLEELKARINQELAEEPAFFTEPPYMAYYHDMYAFSPVRIPRDE